MIELMHSSRDSSSTRLRAARGMFPELAARLDSALERALERGYENSSGADAGAENDPAELDRRLDVEAARLRAGELRGVAFAVVENEAARERLESGFRSATAVVSRIGLTLPEPEAFGASGVDLVRLGRELAGESELTAVPAPYALGSEAWFELFEAAARRSPEVLTDPRGLALSSEVIREFALLDQAPAGVAEVMTASALADAARRPVWTLRLVPSGSIPPLLGLGFPQGPHASLPEMLMLQLMRLETGHPPVDAHSFTWLANPLGDGRLAARHVFDGAEGLVRVSCRGIFNQGPHMGARPPLS